MTGPRGVVEVKVCEGELMEGQRTQGLIAFNCSSKRSVEGAGATARSKRAAKEEYGGMGGVKGSEDGMLTCSVDYNSRLRRPLVRGWLSMIDA